MGYTGYVSTSTDSITWTEAAQDTALGSHRWTALTYDGSKFVAIGSGNSATASQGDLIISATSSGGTWGSITGTLSNQTDLQNALNGKQATLVSGTSIKTINNTTLLGSGNISIIGLPSQTSQSGKFLTTNGTTASWASISIPTKISDLTDDTATYPVDKADTLTGLTATVTELNYVDGVTSAIQTQLNGKQSSITSSAMLSSDLVDDTNHTHKFATAAQLTQIGTNQTDISTINGKIPSAATTTNQLADKAFVNSSVQTATANFRGNWATWSAVPTSASSYPADYAGSTTPTVNDYLVVQDASDYTGDTLEGTWRFKYSGTWSTDGKSGWLPEYQVNETPLTSAQLAALNSGITSTDVALIGTALQPNDNISELTDDTATYPIDKAESVVDNNSGSLTFWSGTKAQYDAIVTKDANTLYNITDDNTADAYEAYTKSEVDTGFVNVNASNLSITGQKVFDGQWVPSNTVIQNGAKNAGQYTIDLSNILPNDNYAYECIFTCDCATGTTSGNKADIRMATTLTPSVFLAVTQTRTASAVGGGGAATVIVGTDRTCTYSVVTNNVSNLRLFLASYRRIGTNS